MTSKPARRQGPAKVLPKRLLTVTKLAFLQNGVRSIGFPPLRIVNKPPVPLLIKFQRNGSFDLLNLS